MAQLTLAKHERSFLKLLNTKQVEYLIIGGYAVAYHGHRRPIGDLDVWIAIHRQNARKMTAVLHELGDGLPPEAENFFEMPERVIRIGKPPFWVEHYQPNERFIHLGTQPPQVEVMTSISGVAFVPCYAERVDDELDGIPVSMISLPCLKANKKASIRPKDADDYIHLSNDQES